MLQLDGLCVYYGDVQALSDVSLSVGQNEIVALVGANGAGKTTTLKTISKLLQPSDGKITFESRRVDGLQAHEIVELGIAHVPEGRQLFPLMTIEEHLDLGSYVARAKSSRRTTMGRVFQLFPVLAERRKQLAGTLSGGEQQMLAIGRGLMLQPKLLMLDEMSLGLAPVLVQEIFGVLEDIRREGVTILLVEQNVHQTLEIADRGYVLENGRTVMEGKASELLNSDHVRKAYLGM